MESSRQHLSLPFLRAMPSSAIFWSHNSSRYIHMSHLPLAYGSMYIAVYSEPNSLPDSTQDDHMHRDGSICTGSVHL